MLQDEQTISQRVFPEEVRFQLGLKMSLGSYTLPE